MEGANMEVNHTILISNPPPEDLIVIASLKPVERGTHAEVKCIDNQYRRSVEVLEIVDCKTEYLPTVLSMLACGISAADFRERMILKNIETIYFLLCRKKQ